MKRSLAREQAFILVFERTFRDESVEEIILGATEGRGVEIDTFAHDLAEKVIGSQPQLDEIITKYSTKWKITRLPRITLALLRLALGEINFVDDVPVRVTINEVVELAKKYASQEDAAYINGVLGAYVRDRDGAGA